MEMALLLNQPLEYVEQMTNEQFIKWRQYFEKRPPGWREDLRTVHLLRAAGVKDPKPLFPELFKAARSSGKDPVATLKGSAFFQKMLSAKGGDSLPFLKA